LSHAVQQDPQNAMAQMYLGIALSEKGQREAAEAALRKAIQLAPNSADAHYNLAFIYAMQKPPFLELARYHYQKSLTNGHARKPEFEKILGL
jgi:Flp pilus assembly protein TadD